MSDDSTPFWMRALKKDAPAPVATNVQPAAVADDRPLREVVASAKERAKTLAVLPRNTHTWLTCRVEGCHTFGAGLTQLHWNGAAYVVQLECATCKRSGRYALAEYSLSLEELRILLSHAAIAAPLPIPSEWPVRA